MSWTHFMDMHSGGRAKHGAEHIYIEAPEAEAEVIFYNRFGTNPHRVTCTCCGSDYSITEEETLEQATAYQRNCGYDYETNQYVEGAGDRRWSFGEYVPLDEYVKQDGVIIIRADEITDDERQGDVPTQGYVWM